MNVTDSFIDKIRSDCPYDVASVVLMGSVVLNETHSRSDLDL